MKIYLVGALFSQAERRFNRALAEAVCRLVPEAKFTLPQDFDAAHEGSAPENIPEKIFSLCLQALDAADLLLAVLEGADVDSGTAWEVGYAYAKKKPVIAIRTDFRQNQDRGLNLMLSRSVDQISLSALSGDLEELAARIATRLTAYDRSLRAASGIVVPR